MKSIVYGLAVAILPLSVAAQSYDCTTTDQGRDGWIPPRIIIGIDRAANAASAYDGFIDSVHKAPIPVTLKVQSETKFKLSWKLRGVTISNEGSGVVSHSFTLDTAKNTFRMRGRLHGYDNNIHGRGTCKKIR